MTLIELMVAMAIMSMVVTLLTQALWQLGRTERLLQSGQLSSATRDVRVEWLRAALEALQPLRGNKPDAFTGDAQGLQGLTSQAPLSGQDGPQRLQLLLERDATPDRTRLVLRMGSVAGAVVLLEWPGHAGRISYQDAAGQMHERWPPVGLDESDQRRWLPTAVLIETGLELLPVIVSAPLLSPPGLPTRAEVQSL